MKGEEQSRWREGKGTSRRRERRAAFAMVRRGLGHRGGASPADLLADAVLAQRVLVSATQDQKVRRARRRRVNSHCPFLAVGRATGEALPLGPIGGVETQGAFAHQLTMVEHQRVSFWWTNVSIVRAPRHLLA